MFYHNDFPRFIPCTGRYSGKTIRDERGYAFVPTWGVIPSSGDYDRCSVQFVPRAGNYSKADSITLAVASSLSPVRGVILVKEENEKKPF